MNITIDSKIKPVGENVDVEEIFLIGRIDEIQDFYNMCDKLIETKDIDHQFSEKYHNFTVKIVTKYKNALYIQFKDDLFYIGKFLSNQWY